MLTTVEEFIVYISGVAPLPEKLEMLWHKVQNNNIPETWLQVSPDTAHTSLAYFLADFMDKVKFWNECLTKMFTSKFTQPAFQISAFYNPTLFLTANLQQGALNHKVSIAQLVNQFTVTEFMSLD